jgi:hypothetical protein
MRLCNNPNAITIFMAVYATPSWNNKILGQLAKHPNENRFLWRDL